MSTPRNTERREIRCTSAANTPVGTLTVEESPIAFEPVAEAVNLTFDGERWKVDKHTGS